MSAIPVPSADDEILASWGEAVAQTLNGYGAVLIRTADQTAIADATVKAIAFPTASMTEEMDADSFHDGGSDTERITIPASADGWYDVGACVAFDSDADGYREVWIEKNGKEGAGTIVARTRVPASATFYTVLTLSAPVALAAADYVTLNVQHSAGGALDIKATDYAPRFWCILRHPTDA